MNATLLDLHDDGCSVRNARTLDDFVGIEDAFLRMVAFLPVNLVVGHQLLVLVANLRHVADKDVKSLFLGQYGSSCTALTGS